MSEDKGDARSGGAGCLAQDWDYEVRVSKLEACVNSLVKQVAELNNSNLETKAELKVAREMLKKCMVKNENSAWELHRIEVVLPKVKFFHVPTWQTTPGMWNRLGGK